MDPAARPIEAFAWAYSFAHLVCLGAPATQANLSDLAQALYALRGQEDPKKAAEAVLAEWPFEISE